MCASYVFGMICFKHYNNGHHKIIENDDLPPKSHFSLPLQGYKDITLVHGYSIKTHT